MDVSCPTMRTFSLGTSPWLASRIMHMVKGTRLASTYYPVPSPEMVEPPLKTLPSRLVMSLTLASLITYAKHSIGAPMGSSSGMTLLFAIWGRCNSRAILLPTYPSTLITGQGRRYDKARLPNAWISQCQRASANGYQPIRRQISPSHHALRRQHAP